MKLRLKRRYIIAALFLVVMAGVITLHSSEPVYKGKGLHEWLRVSGHTPLPAEQAKIKEAVRSMGSNAVPYLLAMMRSKDYAIKTSVDGLLSEWTRWHTPWNTAADKRWAAVNALCMLDKQDAALAVPELKRLLSDSDPSINQAAKYCLAEIDHL